ncbi:hypothetical protein [Alteraurantiacibacter buctensis]|uniref:Uncharacterized protein n=1 Tax=Alteraurantiacibacter buctensis TaxID=1503981 RepID=A0A844YZ08_9SPHN|nr:hypothetical protein [Alteraurantiacibacter buctensis]MXO72288.1 hypothetical protein [Alteraurantiacibacter buctensis]
MIRPASLALVAFLGSIAGSAQAQNTQNVYRPTGTRIISQTEQADLQDGRRLLKLVGACVVGRFPAEAVALLRTGNPEAVAYAEAGVRDQDTQSPIALAQCLHEALNGTQVTMTMRIPERNLRLTLAEAAYLRRHSAPLGLSADSPVVLAGRPVLIGSTPEQSTAMGQFADCLVFHAPAEADALLRGPTGGDSERDNARALAPAIGQCLAEGQEVNFTPAILREYAADGLWARSEAMQAAQPSEETE